MKAAPPAANKNIPNAAAIPSTKYAFGAPIFSERLDIVPSNRLSVK